MHNFGETLAGEHLIVACQYFAAATVLNDAQLTQGRVLLRPTLAIAGHGLELMLKAAMLWNGITPSTRGQEGHDIVAMWTRDICEPIRGYVYKNALEAAEVARSEGQYQRVPNSNELALIGEYVLALASLHGSQPYSLRYPGAREVRGPVTPWLVSTLRMTAEDFLKQPAEFRLSRFRSE